ncbi:hypothetical protein [Tsukamurella paurometabola]|uniref:Uncharacterized protein n=1 Tax=Tsukamurella paurometabola TaxID=2061 RepID=A0ABS5NK19_TSUPA|nr:hypothetical protein [Tsukamurella paurometabola]MBS4104172.1 hypothetical protein [Tsukamurella paurometabola]
MNELLTDITDQLGTGAFKRGTPQRARLDQRIVSLTERQVELSSTPSEPAGWVWEPTGELFSDWWERQDTEARNVWLRQMDFKVTWTSHTEGARTILDSFKVDGDLTLNLDADQTFGPLLEMVAAYNEGTT